MVGIRSAAHPTVIRATRNMRSGRRRDRPRPASDVPYPLKDEGETPHRRAALAYWTARLTYPVVVNTDCNQADNIRLSTLAARFKSISVQLPSLYLSRSEERRV